MGRHPNFESAKSKRMRRDISDINRYNKLMNSEDPSDDPLSISANGDDRSESLDSLSQTTTVD
jgi:hypothetical protein